MIIISKEVQDLEDWEVSVLNHEKKIIFQDQITKTMLVKVTTTQVVVMLEFLHLSSLNIQTTSTLTLVTLIITIIHLRSHKLLFQCNHTLSRQTWIIINKMWAILWIAWILPLLFNSLTPMWMLEEETKQHKINKICKIELIIHRLRSIHQVKVVIVFREVLPQVAEEQWTQLLMVKTLRIRCIGRPTATLFLILVVIKVKTIDIHSIYSNKCIFHQ